MAVDRRSDLLLKRRFVENVNGPDELQPAIKRYCTASNEILPLDRLIRQNIHPDQSTTRPDEILYSYDDLLRICQKRIDEMENLLRTQYELKLKQELSDRYERFCKDNSFGDNAMELDSSPYIK